MYIDVDKLLLTMLKSSTKIIFVIKNNDIFSDKFLTTIPEHTLKKLKSLYGNLLVSKGIQPIKILKGSLILDKIINKDALCLLQIFIIDLQAVNFDDVPLKGATHLIQITPFEKFEIDIPISIFLSAFLTEAFSGTLEDILEGLTINFLDVEEYLETILPSKNKFIKTLELKKKRPFTNWMDANLYTNTVACDLYINNAGKLLESIMAKKHFSSHKIMTEIRIDALFNQFSKSCRSVSIICPNYNAFTKEPEGSTYQEIQVAERMLGYFCLA